MTITFDNDKDVIVYALEKIISFSRDTQYLFVANWVWWISGIVGLTDALVIPIDHLVSRRGIGLRDISSTPRDITRNTFDQSGNDLPARSTDKDSCEPLRRTRWGRIDPRPQSKRQIKKAWQAEASKN